MSFRCLVLVGEVVNEERVAIHCGPYGRVARRLSAKRGRRGRHRAELGADRSGDLAQEAKLNPLPGKEGAVPALTEVTTVRLATTAGDVVIEVYPQAAPNAAKRFVELVTSGFYDDTPISRVVPGFVAQFGINWRDPHKAWDDRKFNDDPSLFSLERGTLAFAKAGAARHGVDASVHQLPREQSPRGPVAAVELLDVRQGRQRHGGRRQLRAGRRSERRPRSRHGSGTTAAPTWSRCP